MSGPYTYVGEYPAQNECLGVYGIFERSKRNDDISKMGKYEVCIPKSRILVQGILRDTAGKNTKAIKQYIADQLKRDAESDQLSMFDPRNPFTGSK